MHKTVAARLSQNRLCRAGSMAIDLPAASAGSRAGRVTECSMAKSDEPITIKKYANRRLYNTGTSTYVTLEDLATMVKNGEDFVVYDAKTGEDITRSVLTQIIFEQENKEGGRTCCRSPSCASSSASTATACRCWCRAISKCRSTRSPASRRSSASRFRRRSACGGFGADRGAGAPEHGNVRARLLDVRAVRQARERPRGREREAARPQWSGGGDIDDLKRQIDEMQKRLDRLSDKDKG